MQFKQILLYAVFSAYSLVTYAQNYGSVRGYVRTESGEPIPSVSLKVQGGSIGTMSNSSGFFTLQKLSPGRYTLHISGVGYPAFNVVDKSFKSVSGMPDAASIESLTYNNYTPKDGKTAYLGVNLADGTTWVYKIDASTSTATRGLQVEGGRLTAIQYLP